MIESRPTAASAKPIIIDAMVLNGGSLLRPTKLQKARKYTAAAEPGPNAHFDDPDKLLPVDPPRAQGFQRKLANYERATGIRVYARVVAKFAPESPTQQPDQVAAMIGKKIGLPTPAGLAVYFADTGKWGIWISPEALSKFMRRSGTMQELVQNGALRTAKRELLSAAKAQAEIYTAEAIKAAPPDKPVTDAQRIKYNVDAVLDALLLKFEPKS